MKKITLTTLICTSLVFVTGTAQANYECNAGINGSKLTIIENHVTDLGNASFVVTSNGESVQYFGQIHAENGILLSKKWIEIHPFQGDTLTIVTKPKFCGRGSCDFNADPIITAILKIGETSNQFFCDETSP